MAHAQDKFPPILPLRLIYQKIKRLPRHVLTVAEVERVMALVDISTVIGLRDRAMMEVLYGTGMRRMELANLEVGDIDIDQCVVLIREGKGRKDRLIPLGERALYWVQEYLNKSRPELMWNAGKDLISES